MSGQQAPTFLRPYMRVRSVTTKQPATLVMRKIPTKFVGECPGKAAVNADGTADTEKQTKSLTSASIDKIPSCTHR